jgi:hypothetical protein
MHARVATFQGDPAQVDDAIRGVRGQVGSDQVPAGLEGVRMMMLVDRDSGKGFGITLYDSEEAMRRGDEALRAMQGGGGQRVSVECFEVPVQTIDRGQEPPSCSRSSSRGLLRPWPAPQPGLRRRRSSSTQ